MPKKDDELPLPKLGPAERAALEGGEDDFDATLAAQEADARGRDLSTFVAAKGADDIDEGVDTVEAEVPGQAAALAAAAKASHPDEQDDVTKPLPQDGALEDEPAIAAGTDDVTQPKAKVDEKPAAKPAEQPAAKPAAAEPHKWTFANDEQVAISPTLNVTRAQLNERLELVNTALSEANGFREIFRCTKEDAEKVWKPIMDGIAADPTRADFLNDCIGACEDPALRNYIERALTNFAALDAAGQVTRDGAQPKPKPPVDPAAQEALRISKENAAKIAARETRERETQLQAATIAINKEWSTLSEKYSVLEDPRWRTFVAQQAYAKMNGDAANGIAPDPTYTLTRAAQDLADQYLVPLSKPKENPPRREVAVPAMNGSGGAAATATRARKQAQPKRDFASSDDAAEAFYEEFPEEGSFR
jgi:hypothetical protein